MCNECGGKVINVKCGPAWTNSHVRSQPSKCSGLLGSLLIALGDSLGCHLVSVGVDRQAISCDAVEFGCPALCSK